MGDFIGAAFNSVPVASAATADVGQKIFQIKPHRKRPPSLHAVERGGGIGKESFSPFLLPERKEGGRAVGW